MDGDIAGRGVGNHLRNDERADAARTAADEARVLFFKLIQAADAAAGDDAATVRVFLAEVDAAVLDGLDGGDQGKLREAVEVAGDLGVEVRFRVEVLDLAAKMNLERRSIDLLDRANAVAAGADCAPELLDIGGQGVDRSHSGDNNAPGHFLSSSRWM